MGSLADVDEAIRDVRATVDELACVLVDLHRPVESRDYADHCDDLDRLTVDAIAKLVWAGKTVEELAARIRRPVLVMIMEQTEAWPDGMLWNGEKFQGPDAHRIAIVRWTPNAREMADRLSSAVNIAVNESPLERDFMPGRVPDPLADYAGAKRP